MTYSPLSTKRRSIQERTTDTLVHEYDKPLTFAHAAAALGVPYHVVQRAARRGLVPTYRLGTSRPYVKLRDFIDLVARSANG
jgi:hypothetical protein